MLAIPTAILAFVLALSMVDFSGGPRSITRTIGPFLLFAILPAAAGAALTKMFERWAPKTSDNEIEAGPVVAGCGFGFLLAVFASGLSETLGALAALIMPVAGALMGTMLDWRVPALHVGLFMGGGTIFLFVISALFTR
jgi:hypothetical protein